MVVLLLPGGKAHVPLTLSAGKANADGPACCPPLFHLLSPQRAPLVPVPDGRLHAAVVEGPLSLRHPL